MWFNNTYPLTPFKRGLSIFRLCAFLFFGALLVWFVNQPDYPNYPLLSVSYLFVRGMIATFFFGAVMEVVTLKRSAAARRAPVVDNASTRAKAKVTK